MIYSGILIKGFTKHPSSTYRIKYTAIIKSEQCVEGNYVNMSLSGMVLITEYYSMKDYEQEDVFWFTFLEMVLR